MIIGTAAIEVERVVNTVQHDLQHMIELGKKQADRTDSQVLVSAVSSIDIVDSIDFFQSGASTYMGSRVFWSDPQRNVTFVGLGRIHTSEPSNVSNRYGQIETDWKELLRDALVTEGAPDFTGPVFLGGFSFDPLKPRTSLWSKFPHTMFFVPQLMLTITEGKAWLTINHVVSPEACTADEKIEKLVMMVEQLLTAMKLSIRKDKTESKHILKEEIVPSQWMKSVEDSAAKVRSRELDKVVLARELRLYANTPFDTADILERLWNEQKGSYIFAFEQDTDCFVGATPERLVKRSGDVFYSTCLAGSIGRGMTEEEDRELGDMLLNDAKNRHEHNVVVEMIKQAMEAACHEVIVPEGPVLYKSKHIQHLFTPVKGQAKKESSILHVVEALHPTPALGGYPQQKAVEVIRDVEHMERGWYAGPVGWVNRNGDGEFAVAIRSGLLQGKEASLFAGCGIVGDSDPLSEYNETKLKFRPMLSAMNGLDRDA